MIGLIRARNEARWLEQCLASMYFCEKIIFLDDNSTDETREICQSFDNVEYHLKSYDAGYEEGPDREWLAEQARKYNPDWICSLDGDEVLLPDTWEKIHGYLSDPETPVIEVLSLHLWGDVQTIRVDGHFAQGYRQRFWRFKNCHLSYAFDHCSLPNEITERPFARVGVKMLHYGNLTVADRLRRYKTYGSQYPVMIQGDPGGPDVSEVLSGEPFRLAPLCTML
jgi:glycosyltransferase involved in cell wall biosynthesis